MGYAYTYWIYNGCMSEDMGVSSLIVTRVYTKIASNEKYGDSN